MNEWGSKNRITIISDILYLLICNVSSCKLCTCPFHLIKNPLKNLLSKLPRITRTYKRCFKAKHLESSEQVWYLLWIFLHFLFSCFSSLHGLLNQYPSVLFTNCTFITILWLFKTYIHIFWSLSFSLLHSLFQHSLLQTFFFYFKFYISFKTDKIVLNFNIKGRPGLIIFWIDKTIPAT